MVPVLLGKTCYPTITGLKSGVPVLMFKIMPKLYSN